MATAITLGEGAAALAGGKGAATAAIGQAENAAARESAHALAGRAQQLHSKLDTIAQAQRTTAVLETNNARIVASGGRDLSPIQRAALSTGEIPAKLSGAHAEITVLHTAKQMGLTPQALGVGRPICSTCQSAIEATGGVLTTNTTAIWTQVR